MAHFKAFKNEKSEPMQEGQTLKSLTTGQG